MNYKFRKGLTAEEAALFAMDLDRFKTLNEVEKYIDQESELVAKAEFDNANPYDDYGSDTHSQEDIDRFSQDIESLNEAKSIYESLIDEIWVAYEMLAAYSCHRDHRFQSNGITHSGFIGISDSGFNRITFS